LLLALAAACAGSLIATAAPASAAWNCDATALRGTVLGGQVISPVSANLGQPQCRDQRADGGSLLPAPLSSSVLFAQTALTNPLLAPLGQVANATGGIADLRLGALGGLPIDLPVEQVIEAVPPVTVPAVPAAVPGLPPLVPALTLDLRPQLRNAIASLQNLDVLNLRSAVSYASGRYSNSQPNLTGSSSVAGLTVLGQDIATDQAVTRTIELLGAQTIDPSNLPIADLLPAGITLTPLVQGAVQPVLDALPPIQLPATLANLRTTGPTTTRTNDSLTQRAMGLGLDIANVPVLDVVMGEASIRAGTLPGSTAAPSATAALQCTSRRLVLIDVLQKGSRVQILGAADRRYVGRTVDIVFTGTNRRVARVRVRRDGTFTTTAPLPRRTLRASNRARYQARLGRQQSLRLKLQRRMVVSSMRRRGRQVRITGRVTRPLANPARTIEVRRRESCRKWVVVKRIRPRKDGTFSTTVAAPSAKLAATYRLATRVRKTRSNPKTYPTFTLPRHVDLG
jgi:hypothetical protein